MHIADGVLTMPVAAATTAAAVAAVGVGLKRSSSEADSPAQRVTAVAAAAAAMFMLSSVHIPVIGGTSAHASGAPMTGMLLGPWTSVVAAGITVFIEAMFGHGGFTAWGADTLTMGFFAAFGGWATLRFGARRGWPLGRAAAAGAFIGNALTYLVTAFLIGASVASQAGGGAGVLMNSLAVCVAYLPAELPMIVLESAATGFLVASIFGHREALSRMPVLGTLFDLRRPS